MTCKIQSEFFYFSATLLCFGNISLTLAPGGLFTITQQNNVRFPVRFLINLSFYLSTFFPTLICSFQEYWNGCRNWKARVCLIVNLINWEASLKFDFFLLFTFFNKKREQLRATKTIESFHRKKSFPDFWKTPRNNSSNDFTLNFSVTRFGRIFAALAKI